MPQEIMSGQDIMPYIMRPANLQHAMYVSGERLCVSCSRRKVGRSSLQE